MKKVLIIIVIIVSNVLNAQSDTTETYIIDKQTAGDLLIKSTNHYLLGTSLIAGSATIMLTTKEPQFQIASIGLGVCGIVYLVDSRMKIRRAGKLLNEKK